MTNFPGRKFSTIIESMCRHTSYIDSSLLSPRLPFLKQHSNISKSSRPLTYYDTLETTPNANQAQVKKQFYNLSKQYHPDINKGSSASIKFREISEAYEVLGNLTKRRMYDKGLINIGVAATPTEAEAYSKGFYENRSKRSRAPTSSGRTPIYDFDEWSKLHYEASFSRSENAKATADFLREKQRAAKEDSKAESIMIIAFFIVFLVFYQTVSVKGLFYDEVEVKETKKKG